MDELEYLRDRNKQLTDLCQKMAELLTGMMKASAEDNPELLNLPYYVAGQKQFEELSLELREIKTGEQ